jgi:metal-dependent amidase/aminoacylase/carboxypeptidase family protein
LSNKRRAAALASLERITRGVAAAHRCGVKIAYFGATPVTANTPEVADFVRDTARRVLGAQAFVEVEKPSMWGEDFAFYLERKAGCFFMLGVMPEGRETYPMLHNPQYDFTDAAVAVGIRMMTEVAVGWLKRA